MALIWGANNSQILFNFILGLEFTSIRPENIKLKRIKAAMQHANAQTGQSRGEANYMSPNPDKYFQKIRVPLEI